MDSSWFGLLILFLFLFIASAFFSGSEIALFSLDEKKIRFINRKNPYAAKLIVRLLEYPRKVLITILIGNNLANVGISLSAAFLTVNFAYYYKLNVDLILAVEIILLTITVIIIAEIFPKIIANKYPIEFLLVAVYPLSWIFTLFAPITFVFFQLTKLVQKRIVFDKSRAIISDEELKTLADLGREHGALEIDEHNLISSIIAFSDTKVREIMTVRTDMVALEEEEQFENVMETILKRKHSRIPVYKKSLDDIIGILYAKDILPYYIDQSSILLFSLKKLVRQALFVPENKRIDEMFKEFQSKKIHIAIVVDEFGGTAGLITLEDIIEELMSKLTPSDEISDYCHRIDENNFLIDAKIPIEDMEELFKEEFREEAEDFDTLGGFIFHRLGEIPEENSEFTFKNFKFQIKEVVNNRIIKVQMAKLS